MAGNFHPGGSIGSERKGRGSDIVPTRVCPALKATGRADECRRWPRCRAPCHELPSAAARDWLWLLTELGGPAGQLCASSPVWYSPPRLGRSHPHKRGGVIGSMRISDEESGRMNVCNRSDGSNRETLFQEKILASIAAGARRSVISSEINASTTESRVEIEERNCLVSSSSSANQ